jgi:hypothetical protein
MEQETACDLRRTNIFLRIVLFLFTLMVVGAMVGLFVSGSGGTGISVLLLAFAASAYLAAELGISQARLYRYGIEEALAVCAVGLLCAGLEADSVGRGGAVVPVAGALASIWIWYRFGFPYAPFAAMLFVPWLAVEWTSSHTEQHLIVVAIYAVALLIVAILRRPHRYTYLNNQYSIAEGLLWLGIYLAINLLTSAVELFPQWWSISPTTTEFSRPFYWTTWVLTWCLPPAVLTRGVRLKDAFIIAMGMITAILTLVTNKPYLGWERHTWDPMLLGALLIAVALFLRRWLAQGPDEVRHGFTARRLSGKDKKWVSVSTAAIGLVAPGIVAPSPQPGSPDPKFGGGASGGGGASSDF